MTRKQTKPQVDDGNFLLTELQLSLMMDVSQDPARRHWAEFANDADPKMRAGVRMLARELTKATRWRIAEPITRWRIWLLTQKELAAVLNVSERQVQNYEELGLPHEGRRNSKAYAWPDCLSWRSAYVVAEMRRHAHEPVRYIDPVDARLEHDRGRVRDWRGPTRA